MTTLDFDLPDFTDPPVGEVVLSVQFPKIEKFEAAHFGRFWSALGTAFPKTETHAPLPPIVETFAAPSAASKIGVQFREVPPISRAWFISDDGSRLIQVQPDRFSCNWRKMRSGDVYPRYELVRSEFDAVWQTFVGFLREQGLAPAMPPIIQCEVGYINHIAQGTAWTKHSDAANVLRFLSSDVPLANCLRQETVSFSSTFEIRSSDSESVPIGRLHLDFGPGIETEKNQPIFILNLLARGMLKGGASDDLQFLDLGRKVIVDTFKRISTPRMHLVWGLS